MNKLLLIAFAVLGCAMFLQGAQAAAVGAAEDVQLSPPDDAIQSYADDDLQHFRAKRATCDLLSFANVNHSACAAHCVLRGKRGGYCNSQAVCVCRN